MRKVFSSNVFHNSIDPEKSMRMKIFVNGKETTALLDSQAVRANIVSESFVKSLERSSSRFIPIITSTARLRLGDNTFSNKTVRRCRLNINGKDRDFIVMKELDYDILLGHEFCVDEKLIFDYGQMVVRKQELEEDIDDCEEEMDEGFDTWKIQPERTEFTNMMKKIEEHQNLDADQKSWVTKVCSTLNHAFAESYIDLPGSNIVTIDISTTKPASFRRSYPVNERFEEKISLDLKSL
jgi:hypothetical protein